MSFATGKLNDDKDREFVSALLREYKVLLQKYKENYPAAQEVDVIRETNTLRTNLRRELQGLNELIKSGSDVDNNYSDRIKKLREYKVVLQKYKEQCPVVQKPDVSREVNTLRMNLQLELKGFNELIKSGSVIDNNYTERTKKLRQYKAVLLKYKENIEKSESPSSSRSTIQEEDNQDKEGPVRKKMKKNNDPTNGFATEPDSTTMDSTTMVWASKLRTMNPN